QPMGAIEVGEAPRSVQRGLVMERAVECGVPCGGRIGGPGKRIGALKVAGAPATRDGRLEGMIVRVGVVREKLETIVPIDACIVGARRTVQSGILRNDVRRP